MQSRIRIKVDDQLILTRFMRRDVRLLVDYLNDPNVTSTTLRIPSPYSSEHGLAFLQWAGEIEQQQGFPSHFAIRDDSRQMIGGVSMDSVETGHSGTLGFWLAKPFWNRGYMTQVVRTFSRYAIDEWNLIRITAYVFDFNPASARVLEKCGFLREGKLHRYYVKDGKPIDTWAYALLPDDSVE